jgi:thiol-disulfide isomerase/thioredoxin
MKSFFINQLGALLLTLVTLSAVAQKNGYQIIVHVPNMKDTTCYLARYYGDKQYIIDTVKSDKEGIAVFQDNQRLDGGIYLFVYPDKHYFEMIIDQEQFFTMETSWGDPISDMKVKGSKDNQLFYDYLKSAISIQKASAQLQQSLATAKTKADSAAIIDQLRANETRSNATREEYVKAHPETFLAKVFTTMKEPEVPKEIPVLPNGRKDSTFAYYYFKSHFWDNVDFSDNRLLRTPVFGAKLEKYFEDLTPKIPDSIIASADLVVAKAKVDSEMYRYCVWWITYKYETSKIMGMDAVFVHMVENYYMNGKTWWLDSTALAKMVDRARKIAPNVIGNTAPEIALKDSSGKWQILSKVPAKYTVLVFWDPDCGHCQKEMPVLKHVTDSMKAIGISVMVYAVDVEVDEEKWRKYIHEHQLEDWIHVNDIQHQSNFRQFYDIYSTPVIYILDKDKKIRAKRIGPEQVPDVIDHLEKAATKS